MDDLVHMFEVLDTRKAGTISAQDLSRFLLMISKMRDYNFDLDKYIENVSGTGGDPLLGQGDFKNLQEALSENDEAMLAEVLKIVESFHIEGKSELGMIGPEEFFNIMMALYD